MPKERVEIFASLRRKDAFRGVSGTKHGARTFIEFEAPDLVFEADQNAIAKTVATAIAVQVRESILAGQKPDGSPLPAVAAETMARRERRDKQAARGGARAGARKARVIAKAKRNFRKQFNAPRLGQFDPRRYDNNLAGRESGMMAHSVAVVPEEGAWRVYFANPRGLIDGRGTSPVERAFTKIGVFWNDAAMNKPGMQRVLKNMADDLVRDQSKKSIDALTNLVREIGKTGSNIGGLIESAEDANAG